MVQVKLPTTLYFKQIHKKKAVLLLHAYSGSPNDVRMLARKLEKEEYAVYAPLLLGHGTLNPSDILRFTPEDWWGQVKESMHFLIEEGYQKITVFGLSMGGIFAMRTLEKFPDCSAGGCFCSPLFPDTKQAILPNFLSYCEKVLRYQKKKPDEIANFIQSIKPAAQTQLSQIQLFGGQTAASLAEIQQPVFLAQAGKDKMIDPNAVTEIKQALTHTQTVLKMYPESGHVLTVDKAHHQLENDVVAFLAQL